MGTGARDGDGNGSSGDPQPGRPAGAQRRRPGGHLGRGRALGPGLYRDAEAYVRQAQASDFVTLFVAVPVPAVGLWRAGVGSASWGAAALGALGFVAYTYAIFVFSVATNPMSLAHYAVLGLASWAILLTLLDRASQHGVATRSHLPRRVTGWYLVTVAVLFAALWLQAIIGSIVSGRPAHELEALGLPANPVWALDLAFALPVVALTGIWLLRDDRRGAEAAFAVLDFAAVMGASILAIFVFDALAGVAVALPPVVLVVLVVGIAVALVLRDAIGARAAGSRPAGATVGGSATG